MKRKLGELLVEAGAVTPADVDGVLDEQSAGEPTRLGDRLVSTGKCSSGQVAQALALQLGLPFADLSSVAPEASSLIALEFQRAHKLLPFWLDVDQTIPRVHVAFADPSLIDVAGELQAQLQREVVVYVAALSDVEAVHTALAGETEAGAVLMGTVMEEAPPLGVNEEVPVAHVTADDLFGSLDLSAEAEPAPLSTDLADQIGAADAIATPGEASEFSALAAPLEESVGDPFGAPPHMTLSVEPEPLLTAPRPEGGEQPSREPLLEAEAITGEPLSDSEPLDGPEGVGARLLTPEPESMSESNENTQKFGWQDAAPPPQIPALALVPEQPTEPPAAPLAPPPRGSSLGRIALKRVAVSRDGTVVEVNSARPAGPGPAGAVPFPPKSVDPELPAWMRAPAEPAPPLPTATSGAGKVGAALEALLARVETGDLPSGAALAALFRLLVERGLVDDATVSAALDDL